MTAIMVAVLALAACKPPLASNLPSDNIQADVVFDHRIQTRFPVGSSAAGIARELRNQGFSPSPDHGDTAAEHVYSYEGGHFPCEFTWNVVWTASSADTVTSIRGVYYVTCP